MSATAAIMAGIGAATSIGGAAIAAHGAGEAANTQAGSANYAAQLQAQQAQQALDFQKQQYGTQQAELAPYLQSGYGALSALNYGLGLPSYNAGGSSVQGANGIGTIPLPVNPGAAAGQQSGGLGGRTLQAAPTARGSYAIMGSQGGRLIGPSTAGMPGQQPNAGIQGRPLVNPGAGGNPLTSGSGFGGLIAPWTQQFEAPTNVTEQNDPGYQFRLQQGQQALERSAAAKGNLLTGNTARDINSYGQDYASNEYNNVYNRALGQYQQNYNIFNQNQAKQYNALASLAGVGQTTAGQLGSAGQQAANNVGNILLTSGAQQGQQINNAAAARASGYVGAANAYGGALSGVGNNISQTLLLKQLLGGQGANGSQTFEPDFQFG